MNVFHLKILLPILLFGVACSRDKEKSAELIEANRLHLDAMKIAGSLEKKLDSLAAQTKKPGTKAQLDSIQNLIELWEENVIEVPGFVHAHEHTHGAHEHKSTPPMTDESMLDYQHRSLEAIQELQKEVKDLKIGD